jgi:hypothetical protein
VKTAKAVQIVQQDPKAVTVKAAVTSAASVAYLAHIYPQLQSCGLYATCCELCSMYPGGVAFNFVPPAAVQVERMQRYQECILLRLLPQQRQQHLPQAQQQRH